MTCSCSLVHVKGVHTCMLYLTAYKQVVMFLNQMVLDGISTRMLKSTSHMQQCPFRMFNMSIGSGKLPKGWKSFCSCIHSQAILTILSTVQSLLPVLSKVSEHHMSNLLYDHLYLNTQPFPLAAWGFQPGNSTTDAILSAAHGIKLLTVALRHLF